LTKNSKFTFVQTSKTRFYKLPAARFEYSKKEKIQKISKFLEFFLKFLKNKLNFQANNEATMKQKAKVYFFF